MHRLLLKKKVLNKLKLLKKMKLRIAIRGLCGRPIKSIAFRQPLEFSLQTKTNLFPHLRESRRIPKLNDVDFKRLCSCYWG